MTRIADATISPERVQVRPSSLLEWWILELESGEWMQLRNGRMVGRKHPRKACALGVLAILMWRAGMAWPDDLPADARASMDAAAASLGFSTLDEANDAGCSFPDIAAALRLARQDVAVDAGVRAGDLGLGASH